MVKRKKVKAKRKASKGNKRIEQLEAAVVGLNRRVVHIEGFLGDDLMAFLDKQSDKPSLVAVGGD